MNNAGWISICWLTVTFPYCGFCRRGRASSRYHSRYVHPATPTENIMSRAETLLQEWAIESGHTGNRAALLRAYREQTMYENDFTLIDFIYCEIDVLLTGRDGRTITGAVCGLGEVRRQRQKAERLTRLFSALEQLQLQVIAA
jgi:hypothetical protein